MKKKVSQIVFICMLLCGVIMFSTYAQQAGGTDLSGGVGVSDSTQKDSLQAEASDKNAKYDTMPLRYPLKKTEVVTYDELQNNVSPADVRTPENVDQSVEYDPNTGLYVFTTKVGDMDVSTPFVLNENEYSDYALQQSMNSYWAEKNKANQNGKDGDFNLSDMQIGIGRVGDKIFGPGGVQLKTQGSVDLTFGFKISSRENPTIPERNRTNTVFDFDTKIQLSANGKVGDRLSFTMNYNTEASFDFDQKLINLCYEGKEDDIIKRIEAGNVSLPLSTQLIKGGTALFGIRTDLQFGKLKVSAIASQQESESKTINTQGAQTTEFSVNATNYDENRHFFVSEYFYNNYDDWAKNLPNPQSGIVINKIEVWVTNRSSYDKQSRNIVAFTELGEHYNDKRKNPSNDTSSYSLYSQVKYDPTVRSYETATDVLESAPYNLESGRDFENVNSARLLEPSEYTLNSQMGFLSLKSTLANDDVLAVAYEYTKGGKTYKVGEFSTDVSKDTTTSAKRTLFVKLLKATSSTPNYAHLWKLAMKNVYSLGAYNLQQEKFQVEVNYYYQNDSVSTYMTYIPEIGNKKLLRVLNLDRLNKRQQAIPDGYYDFVEGYTVYASNGRIIFPSTRPFDTGLISGYGMGNSPLVKKYTFPELYDSTLTVAKQFTEKNKFVLTGKYKSSSGSEIRLGATNVPRGSVRVTAGGRTLEEGSGFTVDYNLGVVTILDDVALESNSPISVSLESQSFFSMQRKSLVGTHVEYAINDEVTIGGTIMHLSEKPLTTKVGYGEEPMSNTIWGLNAAYKTDVDWLTNWVDKIPLVDAKAPSSFAISGEFAQLIPGHSDAIDQEDQGVSYIDDFEGTKSSINIMHPSGWALASTPKQFIRQSDPFWGNYLSGTDLTNIGYGLNRSQLAWFYIDQIFTNNTKSDETPSHIFNDKDQLSNHFVRAVHEQEIYQNKEAIYGQPTTIQTLNLSYYPKERGPYNLDVDGMGSDGYLLNPEDRWAGIMRKLDNSNFENSNIEYIEFWMMDPFVYATDPDYNTNRMANGATVSGQLVFNLGEVSEDVLRDGRISFENGLPTTSNQTAVDTTVWGRVPKIQAITNSFDMSNVEQQDLGLNGLSTAEEFNYFTYRKYVEGVRSKLIPSAVQRMNEDFFSPLADPAGDNFHYFRGSDYDDKQVTVLDRYKYFNGMEANSSTSGSDYTTSSTTYPNTEDINGDRTMTTKEQYYSYAVDIDPNMFKKENWERNHIASVVESSVELRNGENSTIKWYQFKIPVRTPDSKIGGISDFRSIRFIRMYMTGFQDETHLRFGALSLVRTDWRVYENSDKLVDKNVTGLNGDGKLEVSAVNIENDGKRVPVNYVLPPGISREIDPSETQVRQENEQSMSLKVDSLEPKDIRAVYKLTNLDMRKYDRLKMYVHAENQIGSADLKDNRMSLFIRVGSDFTENYYEYKIPLVLTQEGAVTAEEVWPVDNNVDFDYDLFTDLKLERDRKKVSGAAKYSERYSKMDGNNMVTVIGNPSIGEVSAMMIGVENDDNVSHSVEVWVNELRMSGFNEDGGWAALANMGIVFSDLGSLSLGGHVETVGFGGIDQNVNERNTDDFYEYNMSAAIQLGKFFPEKAKVNFPVTYTYSKQITRPEYDPLNTDIKLDQSLDNQDTEAKRDSVEEMAITQTTYKSLTFSNVRVGIASKTPMPYDPANFSFSLGYNETYEESPETQYSVNQNHTGSFNYVYSLNPKPVEPLKKAKIFKSNYMRLLREFNFYYLPTQIAFSTTMNRHYEEIQARNYTYQIEKDTTFPFLTFDKDWTWDRTSDIKFNLMKSLKLNLTTSMNSEIPELIKDSAGYHNIPINRDYLLECGRDDWYEMWKDTVWHGIKQFGIPVAYEQRFSASYNIPINKLPYLDWITSNAQYSSQYSWDKGAVLTLGEAPTTGNVAISERTWNGDVRFNFESLYNKSSYLKDLNDRFSSRGANNRAKNKDNKDNKPKNYERKNLRLKKDNQTKISHRLNTSKLNVVVTDADGKIYPVSYKVSDNNTILITSTEDVSNLKLKITPEEKDRTVMDDVLDVSVRMLMMVRNVSLNYRHGEILNLQGFMPNTGFFGQNGSAPGYDFTFGFFKTDEYLNKTYAKEWMLQDTNVVNPIIHTVTQDFQIKTQLSPFSGLKIDLNGAWAKSKSTEIYYMFDGRPETYGGTYTRTHMALKTAFRSPALNSETFNDFLKNRKIIQGRVRRDFMNKMENEGLPYDPGRVYVNENSGDVLIPAFLSAYSGTSASSADLDLLPNILSILPNWKVTYDGLSRLPFIRDHFKSVNLNHGYKCTYNVNSFASQTNWTPIVSNYGYSISEDYSDFDVVTGEDYVGSVNMNEAFNPLFGFDASLKNSLSFKAEFRKSRTVQLDVPGNQIVESYSNEYVFGTGYRIDDFGMIINLNNNKQKKVKNDLNLRVDLSWKNTDAYIRVIEDEYSQLSSGLKSFIIKFSAEYVFSEMLNIRFYYDRTASTPKVSQGYPTVNTDFGLGFRFLLTR
ncbi:MAG TPA: cell surface protein SprA [Paludibacteraceae bacterium]|nr:cell surface protein SprA [Paludibacteraceae bacterium]HOU67441.1 cell surface protein SprA [Paludibacteraceae bacterium]HQF49558.1 cell surface protein SprA [Paludibacteraceae bacterium]